MSYTKHVVESGNSQAHQQLLWNERPRERFSAMARSRASASDSKVSSIAKPLRTFYWLDLLARHSYPRNLETVRIGIEGYFNTFVSYGQRWEAIGEDRIEDEDSDPEDRWNKWFIPRTLLDDFDSQSELMFSSIPSTRPPAEISRLCSWVSISLLRHGT